MVSVDEGAWRADPRAVEWLSHGREKQPHWQEARLPFSLSPVEVQSGGKKKTSEEEEPAVGRQIADVVALFAILMVWWWIIDLWVL